MITLFFLFWWFSFLVVHPLQSELLRLLVSRTEKLRNSRKKCEISNLPSDIFEKNNGCFIVSSNNLRRLMNVTVSLKDFFYVRIKFSCVRSIVSSIHIWIFMIISNFWWRKVIEHFGRFVFNELALSFIVAQLSYAMDKDSRYNCNLFTFGNFKFRMTSLKKDCRWFFEFSL